MKNLEKIILGTAQFGNDYGINNKYGRPSDHELENILLSALNNDILFLDTAESYGDAQNRIGKFHSNYPSNKFKIISKFFEPKFSGNFITHIYNNLSQLNVDNLYAYLFHNFNDLKKYSKYLEQFVWLKEKGFINKLGVSLYTNDEIEQTLHRFDFIDLIQIPFNVFDNTKQRGIIISKIKEKGIEVHTRSVFLQGLFFTHQLPNNLISLKPYIDILYELSSKYSITISEIALNYSLSQSNIDKVLLGIDTKAQLMENINSLKALPLSVLDQIDKIHIKNIKLLNPVNW